MWFDEIMDDCKKALKVSNNHKGIFVPIFINLGITLLFITYFVIVGITLIRRIDEAIANVYWTSDLYIFKILAEQIPFVLIVSIIAYFLIIVFGSLMKAGSINLYKNAVNGVKLKASHFIHGIKLYFFKLLRGTLFIHFIAIVASPFIFVFLMFYSMITGFLAPAWGMLFLSTVVSVFLVAWPLIVVDDNIKPLKAISTSFKLGSKCFMGLFIILLASALIARYVVMMFGPFVAILAGFFLGGVVKTYFEVIVLLVYRRKKGELIVQPSISNENSNEVNLIKEG